MLMRMMAPQLGCNHEVPALETEPHARCSVLACSITRVREHGTGRKACEWVAEAAVRGLQCRESGDAPQCTESCDGRHTIDRQRTCEAATHARVPQYNRDWP